MSSIIHYLKLNDQKVMPFQYYNHFNLISIPTNGKIPFLKNWQHTCFTIHPSDINQNTALLTGSLNNIIVIDIDKSDNGIKLWNELIKKYGDIDTPIVKSPGTKIGGGLHYYFKYNKNIHSSIKLKVDGKKYGIDVRSDGNLITVPPSLDNKTNKRYKWIKSLEETSIKKMPKWLEQFILEHQV
jgi:bifunctional DNA primase/polymerase-like protein